MRKLTAKLFGMFMIAGMISVFSSCSDDDGPEVTIPQISVERSHYNLATGEIEVAIKADAAPASDITVPVKVAGTASADSYSLNPGQFVLKAGETRSVMTISRVGEPGEDNETLTINLEQGTGYTLGLTNYIEITLLSKNGYIMSFEFSEARLNQSEEFGVTLSTISGSAYKPQAEETISIEVDEENSTAIQGEHFKFTNGNNISFLKTNRSTFGIELIKVEAGKDKLVLRLAEKAGYAYGSNATLTVTLAGQDNFAGTWAFPSDIDNSSALTMWGTNMDILPKSSSADKITLEGGPDEYTFTPNISGEYKNYFGTAVRKVKYDEPVGKNFQENMAAYARNVIFSQLIFPDINVNFSAANTSLREAKVSLRIISVDNQEVLEMIVDDYEPSADAFGYDIFSQGFGSFSGGTMDEMPLRLHLTRVK